jgi:hypothetical protein
MVLTNEIPAFIPESSFFHLAVKASLKVSEKETVFESQDR